MRFFTSIIALAAPLFVSAAPWKRGSSSAATNLLVFRMSPFFLSMLCSRFVFFTPGYIRPGLTPIIFPHTEFADVLEQLESQFYAEALLAFKESDFTAAGFSNPQIAIEQFLSIQKDEETHARTLEVGTRALL